jgi:hypothetical protein
VGFGFVFFWGEEGCSGFIIGFEGFIELGCLQDRFGYLIGLQLFLGIWVSSKFWVL